MKRMPIAARLRVLRKQSGDSLAVVAKDAGLTKPHLWDLEQGRSCNPGIVILKGLARHYRTSVSYIIGETEER